MGYDSFLDEVADPQLRQETRRKTVQLYEMLSGGACRHQALVGYFDERIAPCASACDVCRKAGIESLVAGPPRPERGKPSRAAGRAALGDVAAARFERLRALRKQLADAEGVPAYVVFGDASLLEMAQEVPHTRRALLQITGVGRVKLERYGEAFLALLRSE
jgi:superfamily II DNA helicase RecQ